MKKGWSDRGSFQNINVLVFKLGTLMTRRRYVVHTHLTVDQYFAKYEKRGILLSPDLRIHVADITDVVSLTTEEYKATYEDAKVSHN